MGVGACAVQEAELSLTQEVRMRRAWYGISKSEDTLQESLSLVCIPVVL